LPGTPIYVAPQVHGIRRIIEHEELGDFSVIETNDLSNEAINELLQQAHERFPETKLYDWPQDAETTSKDKPSEMVGNAE
jgi:hypothetical protein